MFYTNSSNSVKSNRCIWMKNLLSSSKQQRDPMIPSVEKLTNLTRMPTNRLILGNFTFLFNSEKRWLDRIKIMITDIELLWRKILDFPLLSSAFIRKKLNSLIDLYDKNKKNRLINSLQHFLSYLMSPTLMENVKHGG